jgi:ATP-binding cassette, subfamily B, bacterial
VSENAVAVGVDPLGDARAEPTVLDLQPPSNRAAEVRRVPRLGLGALRLVWQAARGHLLVTCFLQLLAAAGVGVQLLIARRILEGLVAVSHGKPVSTVYLWFGLLAATTALLSSLAALLNYEQRLLSELTARHAFDGIIGVAGAVDLDSFDTPAFYDQLQRARYSGVYRTIDLVNGLLSLMTGILMSLGIAVVLAMLQPILLVFVALAAVFPLLAAVQNGRQAYQFEYAMTPESRERLYVLELLTDRDPAKEIRAFGAGPFLRERWDALTNERLRQFRLFLRARLKVALVGSGAGMIGTVVALGALLYLLAHGSIPVASALTAGLAMQQLGSRLNSLTASVGMLIESGMFLDDYRAFLELASKDGGPPDPAPERADQVQHRAPQEFSGLRVEGVSFSYPSSPVPALRDVSLEIEPGEVVALVGENGSGKTTLVKLICQLYRPQAGRILWNGVDVARLPVGEARDDITVLFQDYVHYHLSAHDNIVVGRPELAEDVERAATAAERAGVARLLSSLPHGYRTRLGPQFFGGHELSVGQWQRLALARAFFRAGSFLILDEPTASLDPRAEAELFDQMRHLAGGRSVLLVSHRFSTVRSADRIYVLDHGRVIESGTHEELVALGGSYSDLFNLQVETYVTGASAR